MWQTQGQTKLIEFLQHALEQGKLSHAYLLVGPPQVGKMTLALDLAMTLNCREDKRPCGECDSCRKILAGKHADVQVVGLKLNSGSEDEKKERTEIGIEQISDMLHSTSLPPFEGICRVYIIDEAGHLSMESANRLLKTLEEPIGKVVFILTTANAQSIPATVVSRCQRLNLTRMKTQEMEFVLIKEHGIDPEKARLLARLGHGCLGWAIEAADNPGLLQERAEQFGKMLDWVRGDYSDRFAAATQLALQFSKKRELVYETLDAWSGFWRDVLLVKVDCDSNIVNTDLLAGILELAGAFTLGQIRTALKSILEAVDRLKLNANAKLVTEVLMLNIPRMPVKKLPRPQVEVKYA
jgi:DNA polymerase III subunit delta'